MAEYIMSLHISANRAESHIYNKDGGAVSSAYEKIPLITTENGRIEQDAEAVINATAQTAREAISKAGILAREIKAIGVAAETDTVVVWEKNGGKPVYNAIAGACRRTGDFCAKIVSDGYESYVRKKCGMPIDAARPATKLKWILDNVDGARAKATKGEYLFGTLATFLIWRLTEGRAHVMDYTTAAGTMLFDIHRVSWDDALLCEFGIPREMMPRVYASGYNFGKTYVFGGDADICACIGERQAAFYAKSCVQRGMAGCSYGSGAFLMLNLGSKNVESQKGLTTTLACAADGRPLYALACEIPSGGDTLQWLRDAFGLSESVGRLDEYAFAAGDNGGVYFVPAFCGLGYPYYDAAARGAFLGLTRNAGRLNIIRAVSESVAFSTADAIAMMAKEAGFAAGELRADGVCAESGFIMQFCADILGVGVTRHAGRDLAALGAGRLAIVASGLADAEALAERNTATEAFVPGIKPAEREKLWRLWRVAVERSKGWDTKEMEREMFA